MKFERSNLRVLKFERDVTTSIFDGCSDRRFDGSLSYSNMKIKTEVLGCRVRC